MANMEAAIASFLAGKGMPQAGIAAVLGNFKVESGDSPTAYNANEGAIGFGQWEGGRRTALQAYAKAHGSTETDPNMQLGYFWQELQGGYSSVLSTLMSATDPGAAAAAFDAHYEVSSGSSRAQRVSNAVSYMPQVQTLVSQGGGQLSMQGEGTLITGDGGATTTGSTATTPANTSDTYKNAMASLAGLFNSNPDLQAILNKAVAQQWTVDQFQQAVQSSAWYQANSDTARSTLALQASDPATYAQNLAAATSAVTTAAGQLGVNLSADQISQLANADLMKGLSSTDLNKGIAEFWQWDQGDSVAAGQAATVQGQLQQTAGDYGIPLSSQSLTEWTQKILTGGTTADSFTDYAKTVAKSMYPTLSSQIDDGMTMKQIADPYVQTEANLLETDPSTIDFSQDTMIKQALQGQQPGVVPGATPASTTATATPGTPTPLWQFENQVRADPRWQNTDNAKTSAYGMVSTLGKQWGFSS